MSKTINITSHTAAAILVNALVAEAERQCARADEAERLIDGLNASRDAAWKEAGAATATLVAMRAELEDARAALRDAAPPAPIISPAVRSALTQLLVRIEARGDAGHLLHDVVRIRALLREGA